MVKEEKIVSKSADKRNCLCNDRRKTKKGFVEYTTVVSGNETIELRVFKKFIRGKARMRIYSYTVITAPRQKKAS